MKAIKLFTLALLLGFVSVQFSSVASVLVEDNTSIVKTTGVEKLVPPFGDNDDDKKESKAEKKCKKDCSSKECSKSCDKKDANCCKKGTTVAPSQASSCCKSKGQNK